MFVLAMLLLVSSPAQDTLRFTFVTEMTQDVDASAMGQGKMQNTSSSSGRLSMVVGDTVGGKVFRITIDTATVSATNPMFAGPQFEIPSGQHFLLVVAHGKVTGFTLPDAPTLGTMQMMAVLPMLTADPRDGPVGTSWIDTTVTDSLVNDAQRVVTNDITTWRIASRDGETVTLEAVSSGTISADMGATGSMQTTSTGTQRRVSDRTGIANQSSVENHSQATLMMGDNAVEISQVLKASVSRLP